MTPPGLNPDAYRAANADLRQLTDQECRQHWEQHGRAEGRLAALPLVEEDFDHAQYLHLNVDLEGMSPRQLLCHYALHGRREGRPSRDKLFDEAFYGGSFLDYTKDIRSFKSRELQRLVEERSFLAEVVVVDHDDLSQGGASYFAIELAKELGATLAVPGNAAEKERAVGARVLDYGWDEALLYHLLLRARPRVVVLNSANRPMLRALPFLPETAGRLVLHSHEVPEDYLLWTRGGRPPDFVVSSLIAEGYERKTVPGCIIRVQPPIIPRARLEAIDSAAPPRRAPRNCRGEELAFDGTRPVAVMVGALSHRKNPRLFAELAAESLLASWDFLWVGGYSEEAVGCLGPRVFHQAFTENPWDLVRRADVFLLTSLFDPCPYAVLEAWLLQKPVISFAESLRTVHPAAPWNLRLQGAPTAEGASAALASLQVGTRTLLFPEAREYVLRNFTSLTADYREACTAGRP